MVGEITSVQLLWNLKYNSPKGEKRRQEKEINEINGLQLT